MSSASLLVAPREIDDYVRWAARVCGCDPGLAGRIAAGVTFAEVHHGGALAVFTEALGDGLPTSDLAFAPDMIVAGEIAARDRGTGKLSFDEPVRFAAIAKPLDDALTRGVVCGDLPPLVESWSAVPALTLSKAPPDDTHAASILSRRADTAAAAYQQGLAVDTQAWNTLVDVAKGFRVSEEVLDASEL